MLIGALQQGAHFIVIHFLNSEAQINNNRPSFKLGGLKSTVRLASVYTQRHQLEHFSTILGSAEHASKFIDSTSYLAKGHLTPDGDAVLDSWAGATYFFINAVPEWQVSGCLVELSE